MTDRQTEMETNWSDYPKQRNNSLPNQYILDLMGDITEILTNVHVEKDLRSSVNNA